MRNRMSVPAFCFSALAFASGGLAAAPPLSPQSSSASGVTVKATPRTVSGDTWEFEIVMDTHSQELSDDLTKGVALSAGNGVRYTPTGWQGDPPGGHHRKGILRFNAPKPGSKLIELRMQRPGEASARTFRWQLE